MRAEEESKKAGLKLNIQKTKFMASSPFTIMFQQIYVETMETEKDFIIFRSQITTDVDCSHEIKRCLLLERKAMRDQQRHYFANKGLLVKAMVFPVVMYGCES